MITLDTVAKFTWNFGSEFWLETKFGNYIWSDPDYSGDNTIRKATMTYKEWIDPHGDGLFGRSKGPHIIGQYCGRNVIFVD